MKEVDLSKQGFQVGSDCAFTDRSLYVVDYHGRKVYELSTIGKFIRIFTTGQKFIHIAACQDRLYMTIHGGGQNVYVYDTKGKLIRHISVPANAARGVIVGIDGNLHVSNWEKTSVYLHS